MENTVKEVGEKSQNVGSKTVAEFNYKPSIVTAESGFTSANIDRSTISQIDRPSMTTSDQYHPTVSNGEQAGQLFAKTSLADSVEVLDLPGTHTNSSFVHENQTSSFTLNGNNDFEQDYWNEDSFFGSDTAAKAPQVGSSFNTVSPMSSVNVSFGRPQSFLRPFNEDEGYQKPFLEISQFGHSSFRDVSQVQESVINGYMGVGRPGMEGLGYTQIPPNSALPNTYQPQQNEYTMMQQSYYTPSDPYLMPYVSNPAVPFCDNVVRRPRSNFMGYSHNGLSAKSGSFIPTAKKIENRKDWNEEDNFVDIDKVKRGEDKRKTMMIRDIPNGYTRDAFVKIINAKCKDRYDFLYLPIDQQTHCNMGYGYVNMIDLESVRILYENFNGCRWPHTKSEKVCHICYGRLQSGSEDLIKYCSDWSVMTTEEKYHPMFFKSKEVDKNGKKVTEMIRYKPTIDFSMRK